MRNDPKKFYFLFVLYKKTVQEGASGVSDKLISQRENTNNNLNIR